MRPELFGDRVGLADRELGHVAPFRTATFKRASDVEMEVTHGLVRRNAVVLPYGDAFGIERSNDRCGRPDDVGHHSGLFVSVQFENGLAVLDRDDEEVATTALFVGDQQGGGVVSIEDRVWLLAGEVLAE